MNDDRKQKRELAGQLIAGDKLKGTEVYNHRGEKLGSIDKIMIDKMTGQVAYVVMSFGGFLGIGEKYHPLPWSVLAFETAADQCVVRVEKEMLKNAPSYLADDPPNYDDHAWGTELHGYYDVSPYWESRGSPASDQVRREAHIATGSGPMHSEQDDNRGRSRGR